MAMVNSLISKYEDITSKDPTKENMDKYIKYINLKCDLADIYCDIIDIHLEEKKICQRH